MLPLFAKGSSRQARHLVGRSSLTVGITHSLSEDTAKRTNSVIFYKPGRVSHLDTAFVDGKEKNSVWSCPNGCPLKKRRQNKKASILPGKRQRKSKNKRLSYIDRPPVLVPSLSCLLHPKTVMLQVQPFKSVVSYRKNAESNLLCLPLSLSLSPDRACLSVIVMRLEATSAFLLIS